MTSSLLRNLRNLRIMVFHPRDSDGELLTQQLQRIGCQTVTMWPPLDELTETVDVAFCAVRPDQMADALAWMGPEPPIPIVALINYENPTVIEAALSMGAMSVMMTPVRSSDILSSLVTAKYQYKERRELRRQVGRLERKLLGVNQISQAKAILARTHNVSDEHAYRIMREQAMKKRVATEEIARAIINANDVLSYTPTSEN